MSESAQHAAQQCLNHDAPTGQEYWRLLCTFRAQASRKEWLLRHEGALATQLQMIVEKGPELSAVVDN